MTIKTIHQLINITFLAIVLSGISLASTPNCLFGTNQIKIKEELKKNGNVLIKDCAKGIKGSGDSNSILRYKSIDL